MKSSRKGPRLVRVVLACSALAACSRGGAPSDAPRARDNGGAAEAPGVVDPDKPATAAPRPRSLRLDDARWQRAMGEDPSGKQALADALGAAGLLDAVDDGGEITQTALAALPLAEDADVALAPLAKKALVATNEDRGAWLSAILGIAGRPASARESLDPEGAAEAGAAVLSIASNTALPPADRATAISAARALAEKKIVDPSKIPADLDPP